MCVCVCVLGSKCLSILLMRDDFERLKWCLDLWLSCMFDCIHVCIFLFFWKTVFKQSRQLLDTSRYLAYLSNSSATFYRNLDSCLIHRDTFCLVDSFSTASSIHRASCTSRQMLDSSSTAKTCVLNLDTSQHILIGRDLWSFYIRFLRGFSSFLLDLS